MLRSSKEIANNTAASCYCGGHGHEEKTNVTTVSNPRTVHHVRDLLSIACFQDATNFCAPTHHVSSGYQER